MYEVITKTRLVKKLDWSIRAAATGVGITDFLDKQHKVMAVSLTNVASRYGLSMFNGLVAHHFAVRYQPLAKYAGKINDYIVRGKFLFSGDDDGDGLKGFRLDLVEELDDGDVIKEWFRRPANTPLLDALTEYGFHDTSGGFACYYGNRELTPYMGGAYRCGEAVGVDVYLSRFEEGIVAVETSASWGQEDKVDLVPMSVYKTGLIKRKPDKDFMKAMGYEAGRVYYSTDSEDIDMNPGRTSTQVFVSVLQRGKVTEVCMSRAHYYGGQPYHYGHGRGFDSLGVDKVATLAYLYSPLVKSGKPFKIVDVSRNAEDGEVRVRLEEKV